MLAGNKLMEGVANAQAEGGEWVTHAPACSGQAYFVTDGRPCNLQAFADGVLDGLGRLIAFRRLGVAVYPRWCVDFGDLAAGTGCCMIWAGCLSVLKQA